MKLVPDQAVQTQANAKLTEVSAGVAGPVAIFGMIFPAAEKMGLELHFDDCRGHLADACRDECLADPRARWRTVVCDGTLSTTQKNTYQRNRRKNPWDRVFDAHGTRHSLLRSLTSGSSADACLGAEIGCGRSVGFGSVCELYRVDFSCERDSDDRQCFWWRLVDANSGRSIDFSARHLHLHATFDRWYRIARAATAAS